VIFDEFHERHLTTDLGLALTLETQAVLRPELRVLVMSATLDAAPVARLLGDAAVIESVGAAYAVDTVWRPIRAGTPWALGVANAVRREVNEADGDVLVFLPGIGELHRVRAALVEAVGVDAPDVHLLHGGLSLAEQDAIRRGGGRRRRIILATAIAESSITLDGVRSVVDAGLARTPRFDPRGAMTRLETVRVSRAAADQRRGRAGRQAAGHCVRLWDEATEASLAARAVPEILEADLAPLALELACAGVRDAGSLRWSDAPPAGTLAQARGLLLELGATDRDGGATPHGRAMAALGVAPRLAHAALVGGAGGLATLACEIAALLAERDVLHREAAVLDADIRTRLLALRDRGRADHVDRARLDRVRQEARALRRALPRGASDEQDDVDAAGFIVALAFPDRVAQRRSGESPRFLLRNGRGARLEIAGSALARAAFLAIADLDGEAAESRIWLGAPLELTELRAAAGASIQTARIVEWDEAAEALRAVECESLGAIVIRERPLRDVSAEDRARALLGAVARRGVSALPWTDRDVALRARLAFAHRLSPDRFPDVSDASLGASLGSWLLPALSGARTWSDIAGRALGEALLQRLDRSARAELDRLAPTHLEVPSGSRIAVDYAEDPPVLSVRLQELFGLRETPSVAGGRVPVVLHLLSPAGRPVQVTRDLANFWRTTYFDVRKDLRGRYPRHPWPEDPLAAPPTRRVKPR
jgi:ATP-dependent helicase HrpB